MFSNTLFPTTIAYSSRGGPRHASVIAELPSGARKVSTRWDGALRQWDAKYGIRNQAALYAVYEFALAHNGAEHTFRWMDHLDFTSHPTDGSNTQTTSADQTIGVGDGTIATFNLLKAYKALPLKKERKIILPRTSPAPQVEVAGVLKTEGVHYTLNYLTGEVTFTPGNIPTVGQIIKAGFQFDCHAQFSQSVDQWLSVALTGFKAGEIGSIIVDEVLDDAANSVSETFRGSKKFDPMTQDVRIVLNTGSNLVFNPTAGSLSIWLPNPKGLGSGKSYWLLININGTNTLDIRSINGAILTTLPINSSKYVNLLDNGDGTKSWSFT